MAEFYLKGNNQSTEVQALTEGEEDYFSLIVV